MTKTEEQIARDKDAVQKMVGAKSAMESALRRIDALENALKKARMAIEEAGNTYGDKLAFSVYRDGGYKFVNAKDHNRQTVNAINDAL